MGETLFLFHFFCTHMINYCKTELTTSSKVVSIPSQGKCHFSSIVLPPDSPIWRLASEPEQNSTFLKDPIREIALTLLSPLQLAKASFVRRTKNRFSRAGKNRKGREKEEDKLARIGQDIKCAFKRGEIARTMI